MSLSHMNFLERRQGPSAQVAPRSDRSLGSRLLRVAAPVATVLALAPSAVAAPGDLDLTFSTDGKETTDFGSTFDYGEGVAVQPDGKIVVAGSSGSGGFAVARYNTDGSLDTSFSGDGKQATDLGTSDIARAVAVQTDGKIIVVGQSDQGSTSFDFALARYNTDGSLDTSFSGDGKQTTDFGSGDFGSGDSGQAVAIQQDGKIVVAGDFGSQDFALARYNADGSLDTSFSGDGKETTDFGSDDFGEELAIQTDGKIVVAGESGQVGTGFDFSVARYNTDGSLDSSFSGDGKQTTDFAGDTDEAHAVAVQADGKLVLAGRSDQGGATGEDFALARLNADGALDTSFSGDGKQTTDFGSTFDNGEAVAVQTDGRITVGGGGSSDFALARYSADGSLDTSFSGDGQQTTDFAGAFDFVADVALQADGKLVAAGYSNQVQSTEADFAIARYEGGASPTDSMAPDTAIASGPSGGTGDSTPTFEFSSSEANSSFECRVDTGAFTGCVSPHTTAALADGAHSFEVRAIDAAGNIDPTPATRSFTVATTPPDSDGDGIPDGSDGCPTVAGTTANGCPPPPGGGGGGVTVVKPSIAGTRSAGSARVSRKGRFTVPKQAVNCTGSGPGCSVRTGVSGNGPAGKATQRGRRRSVKLGGSTFKVKAGTKGKVTVKLTRKGMKLLRRAKRIKAKVTITVTRGTKSVKKTVRVTLKPPKRSPAISGP